MSDLDYLPTEFPLIGSRKNENGTFFDALINLSDRIRDKCDWSLIDLARNENKPVKIWGDNQYVIMFVPYHNETLEDTFVLLQITPEGGWMTIEYSSFRIYEKIKID